GLAGDNTAGIVNNSYSTGAVSGTSAVGGLLGSNSGSVSNSFWDKDTSGQTTQNGYGIGLTTVDMMSTSTLATLNGIFGSWGGIANTSYPYLSSQFTTIPQIISGTLGGISISGKTISYAIDGVAKGNSSTGANGFFYQALPASSAVSGQNLLVWGDSSVKGAEVVVSDGGHLTNLSITPNTVLAFSAADLNASALSTAKGSLSDADIPYSVSGSAIGLPTSGIALTLKSNSSVVLNAGSTITTTGGAVTFNSDADALNGGAIVANSGSSITTNGGAITLGGGTNATGYAQGKDNAGYFSNGIFLQNVTLNSLGGDVTLRGKGSTSQNVLNSLNYFSNMGVLLETNSVVDSGAGKISITGVSQETTGINAQGISWISGKITSASPATNAITMVGDAHLTNNQGWAIGTDLRGTIQTTAGGGINITGIGGTSSSLLGEQSHGIASIGVLGRILSNGGAINLTGTAGASGSTASYDIYRPAYIGQKAASDVLSSASNITLNADTINLTGSMFQSSGVLTIQPRTSGTTIGIEGGAGTLQLPASYFTTNFLNGFSHINIGNSTAGDITVGATTAFNDSVSLISSNDIIVNGLLNTGITSIGATIGNGSDISLNAGRDILLNVTGTALSSSVQTDGNGTHTGNAGNITLSATRNITGTTSNISADVTKYQYGSNGSHAGSITLMATTGAVSVGNLSASVYQNDTGGTVGNGGAVTVTAASDITTNAINTSSSGAVYYYHAHPTTVIGDAGDVTLTTVQNLSVLGSIDARSFNGDRTGLLNGAGAYATSVGQNGNVTLDANGSAMSLAGIAARIVNGTNISSVGDISLNGAIATSGTNNAVTMKAKKSIIAVANSSITTQNGAVILNADSDANSTGNIQLLSANTIMTNGGNIVMGGGTQCTTTGCAANSVGIGSSVANEKAGVYLNTTMLNSGGGLINLRGEGAAGLSNLYGIDVSNNSTIEGGAGNITFSGIGGWGNTNNYGVNIYSSTLTNTGTTTITGNGVGYSDGSSGDYNKGVYVSYSTFNNGLLTITGIGGDPLLSGTVVNGNIGVKVQDSSLSTTGAMTLTGTGHGTGVDNYGISSSSATFKSGAGVLHLTGRSNTNAGLYLDSGTVIGDTASTNTQAGDIYLIADNDSTNTDALILANTNTASTTPIIKGTGILDIDTVNPTTTVGLVGGTGKLNLDATELGYIQNGFSNIVIGDSTGTGAIALGSGGWSVPISANLTLQNTADIALNGNLTLASGKNFTLNTTGNVTQTAPITTTNLILSSAGNYTLDNTNNMIGTLTASGIGNLNFVNSGALTTGLINAVGGISIATNTGNLTISNNINTTDTSINAIVLNAGKSIVGATGNDDIVLSNSNITAGGRITLYTGGVNNTALTNFIGSGSGHFRYNGDENSIYTLDNSGKYAIYREQPIITVTANPFTKTYDGVAYTGGNGVTTTGLVNGDTDTILTNLTYSGTSKGAINTGGYVITPSAMNSVGYGINFVDSTLTVNKKALTVSGITAANKTYDGTVNATVNSTALNLGGLVSGDVLTVTSTGTFDNKNVGTAKIVTLTSNYTGANLGNYIITDQTSTLADITAKDLSVTANAFSKIYGTTDPTLSYSVNGLVSGDTLSGGLSRTSGENVGSYTIASSLTNSNYAISYTPANFSITPDLIAEAAQAAAQKALADAAAAAQKAADDKAAADKALADAAAAAQKAMDDKAAADKALADAAAAQKAVDDKAAADKALADAAAAQKAADDKAAA
ncbi:MAG: MBG domain-containing protein, partial [Methylococcales bacterium]|nr:MBG domain-containing protein [Methylococcales bacterium]